MSGALARKARAALDVIRAVRAVSRARRIVSQRPIGSLVERGGAAPAVSHECGAPAGAQSLPETQSRRGARWGAAVDRALRWLPGDSACLVRATALRDLLAADGAGEATVRIGVRRGPAGFEAHAWVEMDGTPIAEPDGLRGAFSPLDGVTLR